MAVVLTETERIETVADVIERLGGVSASRIRAHRLGMATCQDVLDIHGRENRLYELVEGILVEKAMGFRESCLAGVIYFAIWAWVKPHELGLVTTPDGMMQIAAGLVRIPDVAFISWDRVPGRRMPKEPIPDLVPDLAIEVLSAANTAGEIARKLREYFDACVRLVWIVDPDKRTVAVHIAADELAILGEKDTLDGGDVLPGFTLNLAELFAELDQTDG